MSINFNRLKVYWPVLVIAVAFILIGVFAYRNLNKLSGANASPTPTPAQRQANVPTFNTESQNPKFDPTSYKCSNFDYQPEGNDNFDPKNYTWQTSAPRENGGKIKVNQQAEIGLRNKLGKQGEELGYRVKIYQPNGVIAQGESTLKADEWATQQVSAGEVGVYTITYEIAGTPIACDGFEVVN